MKALTIWQPWATLIMVEAKPFEFRGWPAPTWLVGEDMAIHAAARKMVEAEIVELIDRLKSDRAGWTTGLVKEKAMPILERALAQCSKPVRGKPGDLFTAPTPDIIPPALEPLPYSAGLGIVRVGQPETAGNVAKLFGKSMNDSDRFNHAKYGWPMLDIRPFAEPFPIGGQQGLWDWPDAERLAHAD